MTPLHPDVAGAIMALDQAMIALAVAKSALLGETSAPVPLASLRDRPHFDAASAAEVAEGVPGPCRRRNPHTPHGSCQGLAPEFPWEPTEVVAATPFPNSPHLPQHVHGSLVCILCGIDHDAAARIAPPPHALPAIEKTGGAL